MKIYIAAPLYSEGEKDFNLKVDNVLRSWGYDTFLPQRDGGIVSEMPEHIDGVPKSEYIFNKDIKEMSGCDVFLYILDGRVPDEGAAVALGYSYGIGKTCVGYKTDTRSLCYGDDNIMIATALRKIVHTLDELRNYLANL